MDARLATKAERAGQPALLLERSADFDVEVHDVERRTQARRRRVEHDLRADIEDLEPVRPRLEADLGAKVDRADLQRGDPRARRDLIRKPDTLRRPDDGNHGRSGRTAGAASIQGA